MLIIFFHVGSTQILFFFFRSYISFLTSASIIWTENEREEVHSMAEKYGPVGLTSLCKSSTRTEASLIDEMNGKSPNTLLKRNYKRSEETLNEEMMGCDNPEEGYLDAEADAERASKEEGKIDDLENSSIIFVEEILAQHNGATDAVENSRVLSSENFHQTLPPQVMNEVVVSGSPDIFRHFPSSAESFAEFEDAEAATATSNARSSDLIFAERSVGRVDDAFILRPAVASPRSKVVDHFNDSMESLLRKLSPIKAIPPPTGKEELSPVACCSKNLLGHDFSSDFSQRKIKTSLDFDYRSTEKKGNPVMNEEKAVTAFASNPQKNLFFAKETFEHVGDSKFEKVRSSRKLCNKTKSSPAFSFKPASGDPSLSPALPLSLMDKVGLIRNSGSPSPVKKKTRVEALIQRTSTPLKPTSRLEQRLKELGSNVKVVKTKDITPMPNYDLMDDKQLKVFYARIQNLMNGSLFLKNRD